jgi:ribosomal protein S18 acetylase RimI-like enzyme
MIRAIRREEIPACVRAVRESFLTVAEEFGFTEENAPRFAAFATTNERLETQFGEGRPMFAFFDGEEIAGYYSLFRQSEAEFEMNNLCVLPAYRHKKVGEALLAHAFEEAKQLGYSQMNIGIVEENARLRAWYERHGFVHTGTKKFDFFPFTCGYMKREL